MSKYRYQPIDSAAGQIRLVTLLPSPAFDADVQIRLDTGILSDDIIPEYEALSYVWGPPEHPKHIYIDGSTIAVTRALAEALPYLRYKEQPRTLWIDAICVNQEDLEERGRQVEKMAALYTCAKRVIVWLGPESTDSDIGLQTMESLSMKISFDIEKDLAYPPIQTGVPWTAQDPIIPYDEQAIKAVISLLKRPWFERLWIVQEIRLANNKAIIQAGHKSILWANFISSSYYLRSKFQGDKGDGILSSEFLKHYLHVQPLGLGKPQVFEDLQRLTWDIRNAKCTDPRDRVYGILSMVHKSSAVELRPDYTKSVGEVYQEVVLHILERSKNLRILARCEMAEDEEELSGIPSWAPNFAVPSRYQLALRDMSAAGDSLAHARYLGDGVLGVTGVRVTTVASIYSLTSASDSEISAIKLIQHLVAASFEAATKNPASERDEKSILRACCRTFNRNLFLDYWLPPKGRYPTFPEGQKALDNILNWREGESFQGLDQSTQRYIRYFQPLTAGRAFFITDDGNVGLAPMSVRIGDIIVVLIGVDSPMVFRDAGNGVLRVVGEAYLDGFTTGEALLGNLEDGWVRMSRFDEETMAYWVAFLNIVTGDIQIEDSRLGPLPEGWKIQQHKEERLWNWFVREDDLEFEKQSEFERWGSDPRLAPEFLRKRGVPLEEFMLI